MVKHDGTYSHASHSSGGTYTGADVTFPPLGLTHGTRRPLELVMTATAAITTAGACTVQVSRNGAAFVDVTSSISIPTMSAGEVTSVNLQPLISNSAYKELLPTDIVKINVTTAPTTGVVFALVEG